MPVQKGGQYSEDIYRIRVRHNGICRGIFLRNPLGNFGMAFSVLNMVISPTQKRTEGRAPVWGSEFTRKDAALQGGGPAETALG